VYLHSVEELDDAQVGYSADPAGRTLVGTEEREWRERWLVIGSEDLCGDPLFVDVSVDACPCTRRCTAR